MPETMQMQKHEQICSTFGICTLPEVSDSDIDVFLATAPDEELEKLLKVVLDGLRTLDEEEDEPIIEAQIAQIPGIVETISNRHAEMMEKISSQLASGKISIHQFERAAHDAISSSFGEAYEASLGRALAPGDSEYLRRAVEAELKFARGFGEDIVKKKLMMPRAQRARMYGAAVKGVSLNAVVEIQPDDTEIRWVLGHAEHCQDCIVLAMGKYTKSSLPTTPLAGATKCRCITTPDSRVLTKRGLIPIGKVKTEDEVFTHRGRWKRVIATHVFLSESHHREAIIETPIGKKVGCTTDHRFMTDEGWKTILDIDQSDFDIYTIAHELRNLWKESSFGCNKRCLQTMQADLSDVWKKEGSSGKRMHLLRHESQSKDSVERKTFSRKDSFCYSSESERTSAEIRRLTNRAFQYTKGRWKNICNLLGGWTQAFYLPLPVVMGTGIWSHPGWESNSSQKRKSDRRQIGELGTFGCLCSFGSSLYRQKQSEMEWRSSFLDVSKLWKEVCSSIKGFWSISKVLFQKMCRYWKGETDNVGMRHLWENIYAQNGGFQKIRGKILLTGMLPLETPLYDLTVEDDHSFIVEGLVSHNSNCKCHLEFIRKKIKGAKKSEEEDASTLRSKTLADMLSPGKPPWGLRRAKEGLERLRIDSMVHKIEYYRRIIATTKDPTKRVEAIMQRKKANANLIGFLESNSIYETTVLSVDEIIDGASFSSLAKSDVFRRGIDGASLDLISKREVASLVQRYEREVKTTFAELTKYEKPRIRKYIKKKYGRPKLEAKEEKEIRPTAYNLVAEDAESTWLLLGKTLIASVGKSVRVGPLDDQALGAVYLWIDGDPDQLEEVLEELNEGDIEFVATPVRIERSEGK